jgi:Superfamily II DNA and RNA helicases
MDHIERGNLDLSECDIVVLDEADEMLNMGFAEDVEFILDGVGSSNEEKTQCLLFSATTPSWVRDIGRNYQTNVLSIDATTDNQARTATTVRHMAIQVPPGPDAKKAILEDIIAVEISKDMDEIAIGDGEEDDDLGDNPIAAAVAAAKKKGNSAMQQKIFGKTIVFTETKRDADELVSGGVFKSLTAQVRNVCVRLFVCVYVFFFPNTKLYVDPRVSFFYYFSQRPSMEMWVRNNAMPL